MKLTRKKAATLGRRGGSQTSPLKAKTSAANGTLGGRPLKYCPNCQAPHQLVKGICTSCGGYFAKHPRTTT